MNRKYYNLALAVCLAVISGYTFTSKVNRDSTPTISDFTREVSQWSGNSKAVFKGIVVNPSGGAIQDVNVTVQWSEFGGAKHSDSTYVGVLPGEMSVNFEITFECDYLLIIQSASPTLDYSARAQ